MVAKEIFVDDVDTQGGEARKGLKKGKSRSKKKSISSVTLLCVCTHIEKGGKKTPSCLTL